MELQIIQLWLTQFIVLTALRRQENIPIQNVSGAMCEIYPESWDGR